MWLSEILFHDAKHAVWVTTKWLIYIDKTIGQGEAFVFLFMNLLFIMYFYSLIISKNDGELLSILLTIITENIILSSFLVQCRPPDSSLK